QPPKYSLNSTTSTTAGSSVSHNLFWQDNVDLSHAIFSFDNCVGSFQNISWVKLTGNSAWSNFTVGINSSVGCEIRWQVYANDSSNNWNVSEVFNYITTQPPSPPTQPPQPPEVPRGTPSIPLNYSMEILGLPSVIEINQSSNKTLCFIINNTGNAKITNISIVLTGIPKEWYELNPNNVKELNVTQSFSVCVYFTIPENAPINEYLVAINLSDKAKASSTFTLKVLAKEFIVYPECPICLECSEWSSCINNTRSRLCYYCNETSNYTCKEYYETEYCEVEVARGILDFKTILLLALLIFSILVAILVFKLKLKKLEEKEKIEEIKKEEEVKPVLFEETKPEETKEPYKEEQPEKPQEEISREKVSEESSHPEQKIPEQPEQPQEQEEISLEEVQEPSQPEQKIFPEQPQQPQEETPSEEEQSSKEEDEESYFPEG
ncbi:MAG: NEW3 domain-containing protein, partial [Candidatus Aenigmarchaeota archaeon]|nr:NEW3 domain-containing protein [Candidatus Aenigmarchaeota archaeon]